MRRTALSVALLLSLTATSINSDYQLGVGGPSFQTKESLPSDDIFEVDTEAVDKILATELSLEEVKRELLDIKTVETVKPDIWPVVGVITSDFGWRRIGGRSEFHTGIDISVPYGTPVSSTADGKVIYAGWIRGYGKTVIVYHGYGFVTLYAHLSEIDVKYGDKVVKGQIIGKVGTTGRAFGAHLHYEVLKYGIRQNPIAYLP